MYVIPKGKFSVNMWTLVFLCLLVAAASCSEDGWKNGYLYRHELNSRTSTALDQVADQYAKFLSKANFNVQPSSGDKFSAYRSNINRIVISGDVKRYTFQSSVSINKIVISPQMYESQKGIVVSVMNLTSASAHQANGFPRHIRNARKINNLVYADNAASQDNYTQHRNNNGKSSNTHDNNGSSSSGNSSFSFSRFFSGEKNNNAGQHHYDYNSNKDKNLYSRYKNNENKENQHQGPLNESRNRYRRDLSQYTDQFNNYEANEYNKESEKNYYGQNENSNSGYNHHHHHDSSSSGSRSGSSSSSLSFEEYKSHFYNGKFDSIKKHNETNYSSSSSSSSPSSSSSSSSDSSSSSRSSDSSSSSSSPSSSSSSSSDSSSSSRSSDSFSSSSSSEDNGSFGSSVSSSNEEDWQPRPQLNKAPQTPFLPYFIGNQGNSIQSSKRVNGASLARKLASEIAEELRNPAEITKKSTLAKFEMLTEVLRTMNVQQIEQAARETYFNSSKLSSQNQEDAKKSLAWKTFRDALVEAGTGPAFVQIQNVIERKEISEGDAAHMISRLPVTAHFPDQEYMKAFFNLVKSNYVQERNQLNETALLSFTELLRKACVDTRNAYNYYPIHSFGPIFLDHEKTIVHQYIPYFEQNLKRAVAYGDSRKIQVYTRALGNLAHPMILNIFEPYLEGKVPISTYQRTVMVLSLNELALVHPNLARSVLLKIYQNTQDNEEVRVAAVFLIMSTNPSAQTLQRMAQFTNEDQDMQVNSAVQSAIKNAANLRTEYHKKLAQAAQTAVNLLNSKNYGLQYSKKWLCDYIVREENLAYGISADAIQSDGSLFPNQVYATLQRYVGQFSQRVASFRFMVSSVSDLADKIQEQFTNGEEDQQQYKNNSRFSTEEILRVLNIEADFSRQVEAFIQYNAFGAKRWAFFNEEFIEQIPRRLRETLKKAENGHSFNLTKFYNDFSLQIAFPTATGLPFSFSLKVPTLVSAGGGFQARLQGKNASNNMFHIPEAVNFTAEIDFIYTTELKSELTFVTPFNQERYVAGLAKNIFVNFPIKVATNFDISNTKAEFFVKPKSNNDEQKIFQYESYIYTAVQNILSFVPLQQDSNTKYIYTKTNMNEFQKIFGDEKTGFAFRAQYKGDQQHFDFANAYNYFMRDDVFSATIFPWIEQAIEYNNLSIYYDPARSSAKSAKFTFNYKHKYANKEQDINNNEQTENDAVPTSSQPDSEVRMEQFVNRAQAGIQSAQICVFDVSAQFKGDKEAEYVTTFVYARSPVAEKTRFLLYTGANSINNLKTKIAIDATTNMPNVPLINVVEAFKADPSSNFYANVQIGENFENAAKIEVKANLKQSRDFREYLRKSSSYKECEKQIQHGEYLLPACRNVTVVFNRLNEATFTINFDKVSESFKNLTYQTFSIARHLGYQYESENNINPHGENNKIEALFKLSPNFNYASFSFRAPSIDASFQEIPVNKYIASVVAPHPTYSGFESLMRTAFRARYQAACVVDKEHGNTFDNRTYPLKLLSNRWYVLMTCVNNRNSYGSENILNMRDFNKNRMSTTILAKQNSNGQKALKVVLSNGQYEIDFEPASPNAGLSSNSYTANNPAVQVRFNQEQQYISNKTMTDVYDKQGKIIVQFYSLPERAIHFFAPEAGLEIFYDGARVKIQAASQYRGAVRGLCGTYSNQYADDFTDPQNCVLRSPEDFAAAYAVSESSNSDAKYQMQHSAQNSCVRKTYQSGNYISRQESGYRYYRYNNADKYYESAYKNSKYYDPSRYNHKYGNKSRYAKDEDSSYSSSSSSFSSGSSSSSSPSSSSSYSSSSQEASYEKRNQNGPSIQKLHRAINQGDNMCFTINTIPTCKYPAKPMGTATKEIEFYCVPRNNSEAEKYYKLINKGATPGQLSLKTPNHKIQVNIPEYCVD